MILLSCSFFKNINSSCCIFVILLSSDGNKFFTFLLILTHSLFKKPCSHYTKLKYLDFYRDGVCHSKISAFIYIQLN